MPLGTQGLPGSFTDALLRARMTGQPVAIPNPDGTPSTLMALPNGGFGTSGGGFGGRGTPQPASTAVAQQPVAPSAPFSAAGVAGLPGSPAGPAVAAPAPSLISNQPVGARSGLFTPTNQPVGATITAPSWWPTGGSAPQTQPPLNQANPNFTAGIQGLPGAQSGPAVAPPGGFQPPSVVPPTQLPDLVVSAKRYRAAHGLSTSDDTDALNAASLAAARAGRNYWNPSLLTAGQPVLNALIAPPTTPQPIQLAMPPPTTQQPQQVAQNLLTQGIY